MFQKKESPMTININEGRLYDVGDDGFGSHNATLACKLCQAGLGQLRVEECNKCNN